MNKKPPSKKDLTKQLALSSLQAFINLVHPNRLLGNVHKELINWWTRDDAKTHQLVLLPRDHQKSALVAYRVVWEITRNPAIRILYISATSGLAVKQLRFIKDILTSDNYRHYWPEMLNYEEAKREKWSETEICVDHPARKKESVRDSTVFTAGLTTTITGLHCDIAVLDDIVIDENAYNQEGRNKVRQQVSYLASISSTDSRQWAVGTRYHPKDLYNDMIQMEVEIYNSNGEKVSSDPLYEVFERQVELTGDGTGEYLWPRTRRVDGKWFGFDQEVLAKKRAQYADSSKFRAQYYNNPNDATQSNISPLDFQYYNRDKIKIEGNRCSYSDFRLNVFAAVDFAFSTREKADFTTIVVVGIDARNNIYVLEIDRFKTKKISEYFEHILRLHQKWGFRKIRAEITQAQEVIVNDLKENYIKPYGLLLSVDEHRPSRYEGSKEERIEGALQSRYSNKQMWHYAGGNCELLEEELLHSKPAHDDIKDSLASAVTICIAPTPTFFNRQMGQRPEQYYNSRFGGIS